MECIRNWMAVQHSILMTFSAFNFAKCENMFCVSLLFTYILSEANFLIDILAYIPGNADTINSTCTVHALNYIQTKGSENIYFHEIRGTQIIKLKEKKTIFQRVVDIQKFLDT